jgi:hypothetical protein
MTEPDRRRKLVALFTHRLPYKASAIFFALVLWLVVSAEEPAEQVVEVRFVPVLDSALRLVGARPEIRAIVAGPTRELLKLYASPPVVRRAFAPGTPDLVRMELRAGDVSLPEGVSATVLDVRPRALALRFETLVERRVPVRSALRVSAGALAPNEDFVFEPESVTVIGPRRTIAGITAARSESRTIGDDPPEFVRVETGDDDVGRAPGARAPARPHARRRPGARRDGRRGFHLRQRARVAQLRGQRVRPRQRAACGGGPRRARAGTAPAATACGVETLRRELCAPGRHLPPRQRAARQPAAGRRAPAPDTARARRGPPGSFGPVSARVLGIETSCDETSAAVVEGAATTSRSARS